MRKSNLNTKCEHVTALVAKSSETKVYKTNEDADFEVTITDDEEKRKYGVNILNF